MFDRSFAAFRLMGYDIRIDPSWFFIALLMVWSLATGYFPTILPDASSAQIVGLAVIAMLGLFASLILHELSHALVARRFGVRIMGITLFIFGGVAELENEPPTPGAEFWIALAGPCASLTLALVFGALLSMAQLIGLPALVQALFSYMAVANLILGVFNLLPAFPMDGGRVMRAVLWNRLGDQLQATARATAIGSVLAYLLIGFGLVEVALTGQFGGLWIAIIGFFILSAGKGTYEQMRMHKVLAGKTVRQFMTTAPVTITPDETLTTVVENYILGQRVSFLPMVDQGELLGYIDIDVVRSIEREYWPQTTVGDVFVASGPENTVSPDDSAESVLQRLSQTGRRKYLVAVGTDLQGVITLTDLVRYLSLVRSVGTRSVKAA